MSRPTTLGSSSRVLDGKLAIVTGASRGIGAAICENLAAKGSNLVMNYTSASSTERAQKLADELSATHGITAILAQADMGTETGPAHIVDVARKHFTDPKTGKFQIDIIVNNAGVCTNQGIPDVTAQAFHFQYAVNVLGPLLLMQAAHPYLPTDRSGRIVNISSVSSTLGYETQSVYGGTKAALESMTRTWARELAERAVVNAVNPGPVATEMYKVAGPAFAAQNRKFIEAAPLAAVRPGIDDEEMVKAAEGAGGRAAYEWEVAGTVGMLCTPEAGWTTGSVVCSNGGMRFSF